MPEHTTPIPPEDLGKEPHDIVGRNLTNWSHEIITLQQICPEEREGEPQRRGSRQAPDEVVRRQHRGDASELTPSAPRELERTTGRSGVLLSHALDGEGGRHDSPIAITILPRPGDTCRSSGQGGALLGSSLQRPKLLPVPRDILAAVGQSHSRPSQGRRQVTFRA
jgi:hypothetical protein